MIIKSNNSSTQDIEASARYLAGLTKNKIEEQFESDPSPKGNCEFITNILFAMFATGNHLHAPGVTLAYGRFCADTWGADITAADIHFLADISYREYRVRNP